MRHIAEFVAVFACALFAGAAIYITLVEHPARMQCGLEIAAAEFAPSYRGATIMQATCAVLGLLSSIVAWLNGASFGWLVGGIVLGAVIPFTLIVILPTNKQLLSPTLDRRSAQKGAATLTLGFLARGPDCAQWVGVGAFPVLGDLPAVTVMVHSAATH